MGRITILLACAAVACDGGSLGGGRDAGPALDAGRAGSDAGAPDEDAGTDPPVDAGATDEDAGAPDAGRPDAGAPDAGRLPGAPSGPPAARPPAPPPDRSDVVDALGAERPDLLAGSCVPEGGSNEFLFELVRRLRAEDDRWGLNWKRGVVGDMSQDVIDYHHGDGVSEGSTEVYIIDVISGHCGPDPGTTWIDQTGPTAEAGTIGIWTLAGRDDL